jgi:hypothetical protein
MTRPAVLEGGPLAGMDGEIDEPLRPALAFGENGGFVYRLDLARDLAEPGQPVRYVYSPELSPAHDLVVDADRQAIREVAAERAISVSQLLEEVAAGKFDKADRGRPADLLLKEAERLGISPLELLEQGYDPLSGLFVPEGQGPTTTYTLPEEPS